MQMHCIVKPAFPRKAMNNKNMKLSKIFSKSSELEYCDSDIISTFKVNGLYDS